MAGGKAEGYKRRAGLLKALAHPSRLKMIDALAKGELCVCELRRLVGSDISTVSKHLSVLRGAGIVSDDKRGSQVFYRLEAPCMTKFFDCLEAVAKRK